MPPSSVHFNGSVNLPDADTVMREISARIPNGVRRMTDGEPGERNYWIVFQIQKFMAMPEFEAATEAREAYDTGDVEAPATPQLRLADGVSAEDVRWPDLGYATAYGESFEVFRSLQEAGTIPDGVRFQMQYPTPLACVAGSIVPEDMAAVGESYAAALFADLDRALASLPHDQIAVQWDVAVEFGLLEGTYAGAMPLEQVAPGLIRCIDHVPDDVPVGHAPAATATTVTSTSNSPTHWRCRSALVNALVSGARRPVNWFSFTVPQAQREANYFVPLRDLSAGPVAELYFALVPYYPADQPQGTTAEQVRLIDAALAESASGAREWGICTECGMGRVEAADVPALLDKHAEILHVHGG